MTPEEFIKKWAPRLSEFRELFFLEVHTLCADVAEHTETIAVENAARVAEGAGKTPGTPAPKIAAAIRARPWDKK